MKSGTSWQLWTQSSSQPGVSGRRSNAVEIVLDTESKFEFSKAGESRLVAQPFVRGDFYHFSLWCSVQILRRGTIMIDMSLATDTFKPLHNSTTSTFSPETRDREFC